MKKIVWLAFLALMLSYTVRAQFPTFEVMGYVMDHANPVPVPVPNQAVDIYIDSTGTSFSYENTVYTDADGLYIDYIYLPPDIGMAIVTASTFDQCLGLYQSQISFWAPGMQLPPMNFQLCNNTPQECMAMFDYWSFPADPLTISFVNTSFGSFTYASWDFGDGTYTNEFEPVHTYSQGGQYFVTLTISDSTGICNSTVTKPVLVGPTGPFCENYFYYYFTDSLTAEFSGFMIDSSYTALSFEWDFGDGTLGSGQTVSHTFTANPNGMNSYMVCLTTTATLNTGTTCTSVSCQEVIIGFPPPPSPCESYFFPVNFNNLTVDFEALTFSQFPWQFNWDFGDNTTGTGQYVSHTYPAEGTYFVTLHTIDSTGCEFLFSADVWVGTWPYGCENYFYYDQLDSLTFNFTGDVYWYDSTNAYQTLYFWDFGDGTTGYGQNITHAFSGNPANGGSYYLVCLTTSSYSADGDSCYAYSCQELWINGFPVDCFNWFDYYQNDLTFDFTGYINSNLPGVYTWEFGDSVSATGQQVTHTYAQSGIYMVTLTTSDSSGCTWTSTTEIWVDTFPSFAVFGTVYLANGMVADDATVKLMTTDSTWQNVIEVASTNTTDGLFQFDSIPMYNYRMYYLQAELNTGSAWYGDYLPTYHISALNWQEAMPVMPLNNWPFDIFMIEGTTSSSGDGMISGNVSTLSRSFLQGVEVILLNEEMEPHVYARSDEDGEFRFEDLAYGTYMIYAEIMGVQTTAVSITLSENQPEATVEIQVQGTEVNYVVFGVNEKLKLLSGIGQPYPNPASGNATIEITASQLVQVDLELYNQVGQLTSSDALHLGAGTHNITIPLEGLPSGLYYLRATTTQGDYISRRVVKSR